MMENRRGLRHHRPYSQEQFENALRKVSNFKEFPNQWYQIDWVEDGEDWRTEIVNIKERCYFVPLTFDPIRLLKIYSTVDHDTDWSRPVDTDAIRIVFADNFGKPKHPKFTRINRNGNWRANMRKRIGEILRTAGLTAGGGEHRGDEHAHLHLS